MEVSYSSFGLKAESDSLLLGRWEKWKSRGSCGISKRSGKVLHFGLFRGASFSTALYPRIVLKTHFNEPASWRRGCRECLEHWCSSFPSELKVFVADLYELGHSVDTVAKELEDICVLISNVESRNWLACFCGDGNHAAPDWRAPGWLLDWPNEIEAGALLEATRNGRPDYGQTKEVCEAIQNTAEEYLLPAKEAALNQARILVAKENHRTRRKEDGLLENRLPGSVSWPVERGKFCDQVIDEIRRIKNLFASTGRSVAEIEKEHPNFAVWKVRTILGPEDQQTFNHPNQWGPPVGYGTMVLSKMEGVRPVTITSWVKAYRKYQKAEGARPSKRI
jgi:hypothetical protein